MKFTLVLIQIMMCALARQKSEDLKIMDAGVSHPSISCLHCCMSSRVFITQCSIQYILTTISKQYSTFWKVTHTVGYTSPCMLLASPSCYQVKHLCKVEWREGVLPFDVTQFLNSCQWIMLGVLSPLHISNYINSQ